MHNGSFKMMDNIIKIIGHIISRASIISALILFSSGILLLYNYSGQYIVEKDTIIAIKFAIILSFVSLMLSFLGDYREI